MYRRGRLRELERRWTAGENCSRPPINRSRRPTVTFPRVTSPDSRFRSSPFALAVAAVAAALAFLPIANWLEGGHSAPWYSIIGAEWLSGTAIVSGMALVLAIISRRVKVVWRPHAADAFVAWSHEHPLLFGVSVSVACVALYGTVAAVVFSAVPITIDELVQLVQARMYAGGRLWMPVSSVPEHYSMLNIVDVDGRYYGQFPPGWPAMLSLGVLAGAPWILGPLSGAISAAAFWSYVRVVEPRRGVAVGAVLLFAVAPFVVFMSGSHMNHTPTLMWLLIAMASMARVMTSSEPRTVPAFVNGLALGCAATMRPVDAVAFALPAGGWYLLNAIRDRSRWRDVFAAGVGVGIPVLGMLWVNANTTGDPLVFGYQILWGRSHDLGFHRAPWGVAHTPARGLELVNLYLLRLQTYLFESSLPSLAPFLGALCLTRSVDRFDRYLFVSATLLVLLYFAYWHDGFIFGPRFVFPLVPMLALWTARLPGLVRDRVGGGLVYRSTWFAYGVAGVLALFVSVPARARDYAQAFVPMRLDHVDTARRAGIENALIFVRESWGTQLMARLWSLGVPRSEAELLYGKVDACLLEYRLGAVERSGVRDTAALMALLPALVDSARVVKSPFSPDVTERYLPGTLYSSRCAQRIQEDRAGVTILAPLLYADWGSNIYARDMHDRNLTLAQQHPDRAIYLLRPSSSETGARVELYALRRDSVMTAWARDE